MDSLWRRKTNQNREAMNTIYECASFGGDDVIDFINHEMQQIWRDLEDGVNHEKLLIKTIHTLYFDAPTLRDKLKIGSAIKVDGVTMIIEKIGECGYIATGEEYPK
jgi:hypothetical protein